MIFGAGSELVRKPGRTGKIVIMITGLAEFVILLISGAGVI